MKIRDAIQDQIKQAMRSKDKIRLDALRYLWSEIKNVEIDAKVELDDQAIQAIAKKEVKKRLEAIDQIKAASGDVTQELAKLEVIKEYMPEQMSREELVKLIDEVVGQVGGSDFGKLMGQVMARVGGKADGKLVQELVREKLG